MIVISPEVAAVTTTWSTLTHDLACVKSGSVGSLELPVAPSSFFVFCRIFF